MRRRVRNRIIDTCIILCGVLIASVILYTAESVQLRNDTALPEETYVRPVTIGEDIIFGNPKAQLFIVEYGDLQCPYCQEAHPNFKEFIQGPWGISGKVAWVWRNGFHIDEISIEKAETLECLRIVAKDSTDQTAWQFIDRSLSKTQEESYPAERYSTIFKQLGIDPKEINICKSNQMAKEALTRAVQDVLKLQIDETPYIQFIDSDGRLYFDTKGLLTVENLEKVVQTILQSEIQT